MTCWLEMCLTNKPQHSSGIVYVVFFLQGMVLVRETWSTLAYSTVLTFC